jgi:serine/threonine-protein kinase
MLVAVAAAAVLWRPASPLDRSFNPPPHSVAILAFANMSGDPAQEYFSDGLSEELIDLLSRVRPLHVVGRTSSFSFKGKPATIGEIARTLNVGAVLEGSVRRQGTKLRIIAELNDAKTGYQLWSRAFDRDQGDLLHMQTEIASDVSAALEVTLLGDEAVKLAQGGTDNPTAFDEFLKGVRAVRENTIESYHAAIAYFDSAIRIDPGFALAYSGRANAESFLAMIGPYSGTAEVHSMLVDALASADRGVALAPGVGETHAARGFVLSQGLLDFTGGFQELTVAQAETPGQATIEMIYANVAVSVGKVQEAVAAAYRAVTLDPLRQDTWGCLGFILFEARQYDASINALQHARSVANILPPQFLFELGLGLLMQGKPEAARQICSTTSEWEGAACLAVAYHALGKKAEASAELAKLRAILGDTGAYNYACIYAQWGQPADALTWLKRAVELKDPGLGDLMTDPTLDPIRGEPGFRDIQRSLSLPPK